MKKSSSLVALAGVLALAGAACTQTKPDSAQSGQVQKAKEAACGGAKAKEAACGAAKASKAKEGACGEGKCGAAQTKPADGK